jgi:hypothetical protein
MLSIYQGKTVVSYKTVKKLFRRFTPIPLPLQQNTWSSGANRMQKLKNPVGRIIV